MELSAINSSQVQSAGQMPAKPKQHEKAAEETGGTEGKKLSKEELQKTIENVNQYMKTSQTSTKFVLHEKLNDYYIQIVDDATDEVMKEIPTRKFMDMYAAMIELAGIFVDKKV
jgi:flagellar protein FlaG